MPMAGQTTGQASPKAEPTGTQGVKVIDVSGGGKIYMGPMASQMSPQDAMGKVLHRLSGFYGDRPVLGKLVQSTDGNILEGFFTVTAKNQDGKAMAGLAMVYAPKTGNAAGAALTDTADRFPTSVNAMFARLKQELGKAPAAQSLGGASPGAGASPSAGSGARSGSGRGASGGSGASGSPGMASQGGSAQPLQPAMFPDGTGVIGLPAGWQMTGAHMGDVMAKGPQGEMLRFGLTIPISGSKRMGGNFLEIPYGTDPANAYKSAITQMLRKGGKGAPEINVSNVRDLPMQNGKSCFLYGDIDTHDGQGKKSFIAQMISTMPQQMGTWQMTLFQVTGPEQAMASEQATITAIFASYSRDSNRVTGMAQAQMRQDLQNEQQFAGTIQQAMDSSDRATAGMSNYLRNQTVIVDTQTGGHATTSDGLAQGLMDANPGRFQTVGTGGYIQGIDY
jgi:hypothetical protein